MKTYFSFAILTVLSLLFVKQALAEQAKSVGSCLMRPEFVHHIKTQRTTDLKDLPRKIFVARSVDYFIEDRSGLQVWAEQSFFSGKSNIKCGNMPQDATKSFSQYIPALMDFTDDKKTGQSFWQIHVSTSDKKFGMWNRKSRIFGDTKSLTEYFEKTTGNFYFIEKTNSVYDLFWVLESDELRQIIRIRFDVPTSL